MPTKTQKKGPARLPLALKERLKWFWGKDIEKHPSYQDYQIACTSDATVLVIGESGSGKELISRMIHESRSPVGSSDVNTPFVAINCGSIPEALAESILFGHERGAFTSARNKQVGKFEAARSGTLFLDEVQNLDPSTQAKLLRVLQTKYIERLGSNKETPINSRVIAATNIPLEHLVEKGTFRKDLYFRLNVCPIYLPPLRERMEDFDLIIDGLWQNLSTQNIEEKEISPKARKILMNHSWPGNYRELEHALQFAALRAKDIIDVEHLPAHTTGRLEEYLKRGSWYGGLETK